MRDPKITTKEFFTQDTEIVEEAMTRVKKILVAKYEAADLKQIATECTHLTKEQQQK